MAAVKTRPTKSKSKTRRYRVDWGGAKCKIQAATWQDAVRQAFSGLVCWDKLPAIADGIPAMVIVAGPPDCRGGMITTLRHAITNTLGIRGPVNLRLRQDRKVEITEAA